jgi:D-ribose pyranose/furanose isomerase RbsD
MINTGILNSQILSLLARVRHTNALVIADRGFPFWPQIETVDISLVDDVPTVLQVLAAARGNCNFTQAYMAGVPEEQPHRRVLKIRQRIAGGSDHIRAAGGIQEARAGRHRADPHRRHDSIREHDLGLRLIKVESRHWLKIIHDCTGIRRVCTN